MSTDRRKSEDMNSSSKQRDPRVLRLALLMVGLGACALMGSAAAAIESAEVVRVVDGDTLVVANGNRTSTLRLVGIAAPKTCQPLAQRSRRGLQLAIHREPIRYERISGRAGSVFRARVTLRDGSDASVRQLENGLAWMLRDRATDRVLAAAESRAQHERAGLWNDATGSPFDPRKERATCPNDDGTTGASKTAARLPDGSRAPTVKLPPANTAQRATVPSRDSSGRREPPIAGAPQAARNELAPAGASLLPPSHAQAAAQADAADTAASEPAPKARPADRLSHFHYDPAGRKVLERPARSSSESGVPDDKQRDDAEKRSQP